MNFFISYSRVEINLIATIAKEIELFEHKVWYDQSIQGGEDWWKIILQKIRECDIFILALSENSLQSLACNIEFEYALSLNKNAIPLIISDVKEIEWVDTKIRRIQYVKYSNNNDYESRKRLVDAFKSLGISPPLPSSLPIEPKVPLSLFAQISTKLNEANLSIKDQNELLDKILELLLNKSEKDKAKILLNQFRKHPDLIEKIGKEIDKQLELSTKAISEKNVESIVFHDIISIQFKAAFIFLIDEENNFIAVSKSGECYLSNEKRYINALNIEERTYHFVCGKSSFTSRAIFLAGGVDLILRSRLSTQDPRGNPYEHKVGILNVILFENRNIENVFEFTDYIPEILKIERTKDGFSFLSLDGPTGLITGRKGTFRCIDISDNGKYILIGTDDRTIIVYDIQWKRVLKRITPDGADSITAIKFFNGGANIMAGDYLGNVYFLSSTAWHLLKKYNGHDKAITQISVSNDNQYLATGCKGGEVAIWSTNSWEKIYKLSDNEVIGHVSHIQFSPVDNLLCVGFTSGMIIIWNFKKEKPMKIFKKNYTNPVIALEWVKDGSKIFVGYESGEIKFIESEA